MPGHVIYKVPFGSENLGFQLTPQEWPKQNYQKPELTSIALTLHCSTPFYLSLQELCHHRLVSGRRCSWCPSHIPLAHTGGRLFLSGQFSYTLNLQEVTVGLSPGAPSGTPLTYTPFLDFSPFLVPSTLSHCFLESLSNNLLVSRSLSQGLHWGIQLIFHGEGPNTDIVVTQSWVEKPV